MTTRMRYAVVLLLALVALAVLGRRLLYPSVSPRAATISFTPSQSYLVILGVGGKAPTAWDESKPLSSMCVALNRLNRAGGSVDVLAEN